MERVDVEVGLRIRLCLADVAQDRLDVGERLLVERTDIAVEAAPVADSRAAPCISGTAAMNSGSTAKRRVIVSPCSISRAGAACAKIRVAQLFELLPRQEFLAEDEAVAVEGGAVLGAEIMCARRARRRQAMAWASFARRACRPRRLSSAEPMIGLSRNDFAPVASAATQSGAMR